MFEKGPEDLFIVGCWGFFDVLFWFFCTKREDDANRERGRESLTSPSGVAERDSSIFRSFSTEYLK